MKVDHLKGLVIIKRVTHWILGEIQSVRGFSHNYLQIAILNSFYFTTISSVNIHASPFTPRHAGSLPIFFSIRPGTSQERFRKNNTAAARPGRTERMIYFFVPVETDY